MTVLMAQRTLPPLARAYLERAVPRDRPRPAQIRITQAGEMWLKPGGRALSFRAEQRYAVERVAFSWRARFPLGLRVEDTYAEGDGRLNVRLFGLPLQRASGLDVTIGEAYRYLAEIVWVPHAIAANPELEWRSVGDLQLEVATRVAGKRLPLTLRFDEDGDVVECHAAARPRGDGEGPAAWGGELSDHRVLGGIRVPTRGEVYWELPEGRFTYWRGRITGVQALEEVYE